MRPARTLTLAGVAWAAGCSAPTAPPRPQWVLHLATDAAIPQVGQQLLIEFLDADGNVDSPALRRLVDGSQVSDWPVSIGILPGSPTRVRARLYRLEETGSDGLPQGSSLIDETATLPAGPWGITNAALTLSVRCFGVPADVPGHRSCNPSTGALDAEPTLVANPDLASLAVPASSVPCEVPAPTGMVCVRGGQFILGSDTAVALPGIDPPAPEHVVQLPPFFIDVDEATAGTIQPLVTEGAIDAPATGTPSYPCSYYGGSSGDLANCVGWTTASTACVLLGKRLPSEAEWEYVAGNLGLRTPFPWGPDDDACSFSVIADGNSSLADQAYECNVCASCFGPRSYGSGTPFLDVTTLGVVNLGGNAREWVEDVYEDYSGPCWQTGESPLVNPVCQFSATGMHTQRGGSWLDPVVSAHGYFRQPSPDDGPTTAVGFRCAKSI